MKSNRVRVLLAVAAAAVALTACSPSQVGAAAVVGGERISSGELNGHVEAVRREAKAAGIDLSQAQALPAKLPQTVLHHMVFILQAEKVAARDGIAVTDSEIDAQIRRYEEAYNTTFDKLAASAAIPQDLARDWVRARVIQTKIAPRLGITGQTSDEEALAKFDKELSAAAPVTWSPRYGARAGLDGTFTMPERFGAADKG
ncbi:SurA N-terminal domain-containing protein [Thermopolyspora sp. NPDC052614]|uniref:SurA N-terminal domain-containing protein n=1 Tax=Thermopolyspora sp. NPDC052614 TaxID=3155682 RepID=UPI00341CF1C5